jgi:hypothetical protein
VVSIDLSATEAAIVRSQMSTLGIGDLLESGSIHIHSSWVGRFWK